MALGIEVKGNDRQPPWQGRRNEYFPYKDFNLTAAHSSREHGLCDQTLGHPESILSTAQEGTVISLHHVPQNMRVFVMCRKGLCISPGSSRDAGARARREKRPACPEAEADARSYDRGRPLRGPFN